MSVSLPVVLPDNFRPTELLAFHGRDPEGLAEQADAGGVRKGLVWQGRPACLTLRLGPCRVEAALLVDGPAPEAGAVTAMVRRMLGLTQPVEAFEAHYRHHPMVGRLIEKNAGLRLPVAASPFEALVWAITGQQISVAAAVSIRRRLIEAAAVRHSGGLFCFPDAAAILRLDEERLGRAGFSRSKARAVHAVARGVADGSLPLDVWLDGKAMTEVGEHLLALPGIGPWTVSYALLRGFGWLDGSLHGDVAVRRSLQALLGSADKVDEKTAERWLAPFSPWRALVAAHLWAWGATVAY